MPENYEVPLNRARKPPEEVTPAQYAFLISLGYPEDAVNELDKRSASKEIERLKRERGIQ